MHLLGALGGDAELHDRDRAGVARRGSRCSSVTTLSRIENTSVFSASSSTTASTTSWRSAMSPRSVVKLSRANGRVALLLGELARAHATVERADEPLLAALGSRGVDLADDHVEPGAAAHLGDARPHEAAADDSDPRDLACDLAHGDDDATIASAAAVAWPTFSESTSARCGMRTLVRVAQHGVAEAGSLGSEHHGETCGHTGSDQIADQGRVATGRQCPGVEPAVVERIEDLARAVRARSAGAASRPSTPGPTGGSTGRRRWGRAPGRRRPGRGPTGRSRRGSRRR